MWKYVGCIIKAVLDSSWNVMARGDAREGKWKGNWRMEWVASTLHTTSEHGVSSITTADAHTSAASSRQNWRPRWFKWTRPFRRKTKSGFCARAITFQLASTSEKSECTHFGRWPSSLFRENMRYSLATFARCTTVTIDVWLFTKMSVVMFSRKCIANIFR